CAAILWKDASRAAEAAEALKITAADLMNLGILDELLPEPLGGAHADPLKATQILREALRENLESLLLLSPSERRDLRYQKFRQIGVFMETASNGQVK
ncbi:MAG: acetyl-CoA carboxylase carboxyl transferase subunit alpha, partial [Cyanobacteria bacterium P01_H01_bin.153]